MSFPSKLLKVFNWSKSLAESELNQEKNDLRVTIKLQCSGQNVSSLWCLCVSHLVYEQRACYFRAGVLRVDHRDAPSGRSVIYCLNRNVSCYFLLAKCWNERRTFTNHFIYNVLPKLHRYDIICRTSACIQQTIYLLLK